MNRKAQGQILTTIPVMFIIFIILFIYVLLSFSLGLRLDNQGITTKANTGLDDFLLKEIRVGENFYPVANIFLKWADNFEEEVTTQDIREGLIELLEKKEYSNTDPGDFYQGNLNIEELNCIGLSFSRVGEDFLWRQGLDYKSISLILENGRIRENFISDVDAEEIKEFSFIFDDKPYIAQYYYTECKNE